MKKNFFRSTFYITLFAGVLVFGLIHWMRPAEVGVLKLEETEKRARKKARAEYFERMLRDPATRSIPENIRRLELQHAAQMPKRLNGSSKIGVMTQFSWTEAGPNDIGGRTRALAVDVNNSNTILAGGVSGGIWKSTNGGSSWTLKTDPAMPASITYITQDRRPGNTNKWYATTGEFIGSNTDRGSRAFYYGQGIYESTDNGESWDLIPFPNQDPLAFDSPFDYGLKVLVSPTTGTLFIASNGFGVMRSTELGSNLFFPLGSDINAIWADFDIASDGTLIAVLSDGYFDDTPSESPGVYRSTNDGQTWQNITPDDYPATADRSVIAFAPSNPNVAYMLTFTGNVSPANNAYDEEEEMQLYKFNVGAGTSQNLTGNLPDFGGEIGDVYTQGGFNMVMAVKPNDENHVFIGATNLYVSRNGFATKPSNATTNWIGGYSTANNLEQYANHHPDLHALFFDPQNPDALWSGHDGGLSYVPDVTTTQAFDWQNKNNGYNVTQYFHVALPPDPDDDRILGGTQDNGSLFFSFNPSSLLSTTSADVSSGDGTFAFMGKDYAMSSIQNGELSVHSYTLDNNLQFVKEITPAGASGQLFVNPFTTDPIEETIVYYPAGKSLWRRSAGSSSNTLWTQLANLQLTGAYEYTALAAGSNNGTTVLYLGASGDNLTPQMRRFDNASTSTSAATSIPISGAVADAYIHSIAVNPENADEVLVAMSNYNIVGLYYTTNAGATWTAVEGNLQGNANAPGPSIRSVAIIPLNSDTGYIVGTSTGIYSAVTLNGNSTVWQQEASSELGSVIVESIATRTSDGRVALATHGRGIFIGMPLVPVSNEDEAPIQPELFSLAQNYPNPFNPSTIISFTLAHASRVTLAVYDTAGREVRTLLADALKEPGQHSVDFNAEGLASGSYIYQMEAASLSDGETSHKVSRVMVLAR